METGGLYLEQVAEERDCRAILAGPGRGAEEHQSRRLLGGWFEKLSYGIYEGDDVLVVQLRIPYRIKLNWRRLYPTAEGDCFVFCLKSLRQSAH